MGDRRGLCNHCKWHEEMRAELVTFKTEDICGKATKKEVKINPVSGEKTVTITSPVLCSIKNYAQTCSDFDGVTKAEWNIIFWVSIAVAAATIYFYCK